MPIRILSLLTLLDAAAIGEAKQLSAFAHNSIWLSLSSGLWTLQHHAAPQFGLFSQYAELRWIDSSWGFGVLVATTYKLLGLRALPVLLMCFKALFSAMAFLLAGGLCNSFWMAVILSAVAQYAVPGLGPGALSISIILFGVEVILLVESRKTGSLRPLFWLPLLFLLWANLHIQFVNGLLVLVLFAVVVVVESYASKFAAFRISNNHRALPGAKVAAVVFLSGIATLITPYGYRVYQTVPQDVFDVSFSSNFAEVHYLEFRRPADYLLVLLPMAALFALGRRRSSDLFGIGLLLSGILLAFRSQRDVWLIVLPSIGIIPEALGGETHEERFGPNRRWLVPSSTAALAVLLLVVAAGSWIPASQLSLLDKAGKNQPVHACDFIRQQRLPTPIFNDYNWGDFLSFYLPEYPVVADSRVSLYGQTRFGSYIKEITGQQSLDADPMFRNANTILVMRPSDLGAYLSSRADYRKVYSDNLSLVLLKAR